MTNLINLDLSFDNISDISFLGTLTNLQTLNLTVNKVTNILAMSNLKSLVNLNLKYNCIPNTDQSWAPLHQLANYNPDWDNVDVRSSQR